MACAYRTHWTRAAVKGRPVPEVSPSAFSRVAIWPSLCMLARARTRSTTAAGVRRLSHERRGRGTAVRVAFLEGGVAECLPHVHDRQADFGRFLWPEPGI